MNIHYFDRLLIPNFRLGVAATWRRSATSYRASSARRRGMFKDILKAVFEFLWKRKTELVCSDVFTLKYDKGGLNLIICNSR